MSDSKWERLIDSLAELFPSGLHVAYKLVHSEVIQQTTLTVSDFKPFFAEPTLYREIEWVDFLHFYEGCADPDNRKSGKMIFEQQVAAIEVEIQRLGQFELKQVQTGLRLYAYK
jgi:hypothetical protein